jgi:zinc protease
MQAIELLADAMQHAAFNPEEFDRELSVIRQELADGEVNRRRVQWNLLNQTLYTVHPDPPSGHRLSGCAEPNHQRRDHRFLPAALRSEQSGLSWWSVRWKPRPCWTMSPRYGPGRREATRPGFPAAGAGAAEPREAVREMDGTGYDLVLAWPTVDLSHPDLYALDVAAYVLAEGESSRLARRLKYEQPLVLSVGSASYTPHFAPGFFAVFASAQAGTWQETSDEIVRAVYRLRDELVAPDELDKAKKQKAAELVFGAQTVEQAADSLGRNFLATGDPLFDKHYVEAIQQVTAEQVRDVARRYFVPERFNRVLIARRAAPLGRTRMPRPVTKAKSA